MFKHNRLGFTLVELLAVIVILAIILAIAIPGISSIINSASRSSLESSAKMVLKAIEYKMLEEDTFIPTSVNETNIKSLLNIGDDNYQTLTVKEINDVLYVTIVGKNKWDKLTVSGTKTVSVVNDTVTSLTRGANAPVLATGMTPIKWNGTAWINTTTTDTAWYNYDTTNKIWANAMTADGSMWVWIPRYIYKIPTASWHTSTTGTIDIQFTKGIDDNWNKASIGNIILDESATSSNDTWTNHPAFTFGDTELTGIWVAKFEASNTTIAVKFIPNVTSLRSQTVETFFNSGRNIETNPVYGWGTTGNDIDTHMMKNTEWGVVAYLAQSTYGKNAEIWINNSSAPTTGCAGNSVSEDSLGGCLNAYNTTLGFQASTTGNIYGIYDISGGAREYVSAYVDNGDISLNTYGSSILASDIKYKDVYAVGSTDTAIKNYDLAINKKGDAVYETSLSGMDTTSWNSDHSKIPRIGFPWFIRGGHCTYLETAGAFNVDTGVGLGYGGTGFRAVLLVGSGL